MFKFDGHKFVVLLNALSEADTIRDEEFCDQLLIDLIPQLKDLDLTNSAKKASSIRFHLGGEGTANLARDLAELRSRIEDELEERLFYFIRPEEAQFIDDGKNLFPQIVHDKFPKAIDDLHEAAQCLGFTRSTACVFHLMRAMERVLYAIGQHLGAPIIHEKKGNVKNELTWGEITKNIRKEIEKKEEGNEKDKWHEILLYLIGVKDCWRNSTMHPRSTYTQEEARKIFDTVKAFMEHVAEQLPNDQSSK